MSKEETKTGRSQFVTKIGVIAATVGSAVGLGNIWRFPYEVGTHGGGAFLICYLFFIIAIGVPLLCAESAVGRRSRSNVVDAYRKLSGSNKWKPMGYLAVLTAIVILGFYCVVSGWTMEYMYQSVAGNLHYSSQPEYAAMFSKFIGSDIRPIVWTLIFLAINFRILIKGVEKGIEKMSNIMMPLLFLILIAFCINSLMMPGAQEGLKFMFTPDFSKITPAVLLSALGQAFFSLSIGMGCVLTYGSYFSDSTNLPKTAGIIAVCDTLVAILAGLMIFPAVFTFGGTPAAGPTLVFEVLPAIFNHLPLGSLWASLFFLLLFIASLTSSISMFEIGIAFFTEKFKIRRIVATSIITGITAILAVFCSLSFGSMSTFTIFGKNMFDLSDYVSSNIFMPIGGLGIAIFTGWVVNKQFLKNQLSNNGSHHFAGENLIIFSLRFLSPAAIVLIFLNSLGII